MHPEYAADPDFVARFKKEIASLLRLPRHPNLVGIEAATAFGFCYERRTMYLAMEYIDGRTLESYLAAKGPLTEGQVRKIFPDAIAGLAEAHKAGIVHRDIKPGNFIIRKSDYRLVLVDFGLAVGVEELGQTKVGGISIQFAAPEQHYGKSATQASDVFSLCAVIHYALNYDKPERRTPNEFSAALVPEALRACLTRGMMTSATDRLQDAAQLGTALQEPPIVVAQPIDVNRLPPPAPSPTPPPPKKKTPRPPSPPAPGSETARQPPRSPQRLGPTLGGLCMAVMLCCGGLGVVVYQLKPTTNGPSANSSTPGKLFTNPQATTNAQSGNPITSRTLPTNTQATTNGQSGNPITPVKLPTNPQRGDTITNRFGMKFAWVPPGSSWLGGGGGQLFTKPFTLNKSLWCGVYEVTQGEWHSITGGNPSHFKGNPRYPVENVSWHEVDAFIQELKQQCSGDGLLYRLPSEQEWEYICRGGPISQDESKYFFYFARSKTDLSPAPTNDLSSTQANFNGNIPLGSAAKGPYLQRPSEVGSYLPNPLGIYDLHGNVWEWTSSAYDGGLDRVLRGGSWGDGGSLCPALARNRCEPGLADYYVGFRLLAVPSGQ